jgi:hypothetical protein
MLAANNPAAPAPIITTSIFIMRFFIIAMIMHKAKLDRDNRCVLPFRDKNTKENENSFFIICNYVIIKK